MQPEYHVNSVKESCYLSSVRESKSKEKHIECSLSKEDIGNLLQGNAVELLFLNDDYAITGMIDIKLSSGETNFDISDKVNNMLTAETVPNDLPCSGEKIILETLSDSDLNEFIINLPDKLKSIMAKAKLTNAILYSGEKIFLEKLSDSELNELMKELLIFELTGGSSDSRLLNKYTTECYHEKEKHERMLHLLSDVNKSAAVRWKKLQDK